MARKTVGYVHMEWTCPNCGTRNRGVDKMCVNCATAQPENVQFEQVAQEQLVEDERLIAQAQAGADVHCPFCGTRNPATAVKCQNCFGELTDATARSSGQIVGQHTTRAVPDVVCDYCQTVNAGTATQCSNCLRPLAKPIPNPQSPAPRPKPRQKAARSKTPIFLYLFIGIIIFACGFIFFLSTQRQETVGRVTNVEWERTVNVQGLVPVTYETWFDEIPQGAERGFCTEEVRFTSPNPLPNSQEVCGQPYTVDTGTGIGEVVQTCEYLVFDDFCQYSVDEWQVIDQQVVSGNDFAPFWPEPSLGFDERLGEREENYIVEFRTDGTRYTYRPDSLNEYLQFEEGSTWVLEINGLNTIVDVRRE